MLAIDFKSLLESVPGCYLVLGPDFRILAISDAYLEAIMTTREAITDKPLFEVFTGNPATPDSTLESNLRASLLYVLKTKNQHKMAALRCDIRKPDGSYEERLWNLLNKPVLSTAQEVKYIIHSVIDITQSIKAEEKIREQMSAQAEELRQANKELETFSYSVSHDLKAPLRSLHGFSKLLTEEYSDKFDEDGKRWLHFISENANRMSDLISDMLAFSNVSRSTVRKCKVSMTSLAGEVFESERKNYEAKSIHFDLRDLPDSQGDLNMLKLLWQHLISNALKYSSKKKSIHITISASRAEKFNVYTIKDQGDGFDEKYKDKLFAVFQRLHSIEEFEGRGVGLAIVNRIIQKHQGWITANSKKGSGTEFIFALPTTNTFNHE